MTFCVDGEPHSIVLQGEILCQATPDVLYIMSIDSPSYPRRPKTEGRS